MDMLRLILPQLVGVVTFLGVLWLSAAIVRTKIDEDIKKYVFKICGWVTLATVVFFTIWVIKIASVNEIPRSVIDRTNEEKMINNFEERSARIANTPKEIDTLTIKNK